VFAALCVFDGNLRNIRRPWQVWMWSFSVCGRGFGFTPRRADSLIDTVDSRKPSELIVTAGVGCVERDELFWCGLLLGELVAKLLLALVQIRFVTVGIDECIRVAAEQAFLFFHQMEKAPVRRQENVARQTIQ
jgi:hypothetical protein